jgi:hypothetical protein
MCSLTLSETFGLGFDVREAARACALGSAFVEAKAPKLLESTSSWLLAAQAVRSKKE